VCDEVLDLLAGGLAQSLGAAEIDGVGFDQDGIELVLANDVAEVIADARSTVVATVCGC